MKTNSIKIGLLLCSVLLAFSGCYKDKGNYDYTNDSDLVQFRGFINVYFKMNEPIEVGVPITVAPSYDYHDLAYEWKTDGRIIGQDSLLQLENAAAGGLVSGDNYVEFIVKDTRYGMRYNSLIHINIVSEYGDGWVILTDDSGVSKVHYLTMKDENTANDPDMDVFEKVNGEPLGTGPIRIRKNYYDDKSAGVIFEWEILQQSRTVTAGLGDWVQTGVVNDEFLGGTPAGFVGVNGFNRSGGSAILDREGNIYMRNHTMYNGYPVPHEGHYTGTPVYIEKGLQIDQMTNFDHYFGMPWSYINHAILHDNKNNRMVMIEGFCLNATSTTTFGNVSVLDMYNKEDALLPGSKSPSDASLTMPDLADLGSYKVVNMVSRPQYYDIFGDPQPANSDNFVVLKATDGKQYILRYKLTVDVGLKALQLTDLYEFPADGGFDEQSQLFVYAGGDEYLLYTGGGADRNKLYLFNFNTKQPARCIHEAASDITAIRSGTVHLGLWELLGMSSNYFERFVVGTASGELSILDMSASSLSQNRAKVIKSFNGLGRVVDINFHEQPNDYGGTGY